MTARFKLDGLHAAMSDTVKRLNAVPLPPVGAGLARAKARKAVATTESESQIQQRLMTWWKYAHKGLGVRDERLLMAFPLQGARTPRNGARMKAEGLRAGTPDMLLACAGNKPFDSHGLWIELKRTGGKPSPSQTEFLSMLRCEGYQAQLCIGFDAAKVEIERYLKL